MLLCAPEGLNGISIACQHPASLFGHKLTVHACRYAAPAVFHLSCKADHAFQPNYYSPHCSDGKSDISIVAVLQVRHGGSFIQQQ
jgi:hypothetical protein